ncbi:SAM-dependent methyltransferase [Corynebacterium humireducens NBRC 106098 = DSM 45392]|uniref:SAM-dependent methyltransferase n=1 Tax=Corynebacterium humireducens NBRC 106098 = DSM 45392 TaxID=1223515 RepID=A0A0B5D2E5_9CORY|nr:class I SAM-dependent methyltransferase [Corynebacterium humireducens]AJE33055.1 SAM-dependent methyltransferase [Corynebacterium humireducens NBRC 106098 = DSM 45392]
MTTPETTASQAASANRFWWDLDAADYHERHASYLDGFHWCPEMLAESEARLLGDVTNASVLEIGCGSAPCASWLQADGVGFVTGFDLSRGMLSHADGTVPLVRADAQALPYRDASFDVAFSAFGALPFVPDVTSVLVDVARVLRPGGRLVFSVNHPMRWIFPDDPTAFGAEISYFEREYTETADDGTIIYAEFHRTLGDWVRALHAAGFHLTDLLEPEWPEHLTQTWGQWSPERGRIFPGTAIFVAEKR